MLMKIDRVVLTKIVLLFLLWRAVLLGVSVFADQVLPYAPTFPYATSLLPSFELPRWLYSFANFDGVHYVTIANQGYLETNYIQAFFPLFPYILLHGPKLLVGNAFNPLVWGLLISNVAFIASLYAGFQLIRQKCNQKIAWGFVLMLLAFPTSFFFGSLYTESLFLLFTFVSFLAAHSKKWWLAGIAAALASATRVVGIFLVPALFVELWMQSHKHPKEFSFAKLRQFLTAQWKQIGLILIGVLGLAAYMLYLQVHFQDPLYFVHVQSEFGAGRSESIVVYPQVAFRALKILLTSPFDLKYVTYVSEFLAGTVGLVGLVLAVCVVPASWSVFALLAFLFPTLSGTFSSMPRYILISFPLFVLLAKVRERSQLLWVVLLALFCILLLVETVLFIQGYWVA